MKACGQAWGLDILWDISKRGNKGQLQPLLLARVNFKLESKVCHTKQPLHPQHRPAVIKPQQSQTKLSDRYVSNLVGLSGSAAVKFSDLGAGNLPVWKKTVRN